MNDSISLDEWESEIMNRKDNPWRKARRNVRNLASYIRWDIHQGFYGLFYWFRFAWRWRPWDFQYGLDALELHLRKLEPSVRNGCHEGREKDADDIKRAIELLVRFREDPLADELVANKITAKKYIKQRDRDWKDLFHLMRDQMTHWWN